MKENYNKIINTLKTLEEKNSLLKNLELLISKIHDATEVDGSINLKITRDDTIFNIQADDLLKKIENKKKNIEEQVELLLSNITING